MTTIEEPIVIIDFGSPLNKVMRRKIRELNVYSMLVPENITAEEIKQLNPKGIILGASPASIYTDDAPKPDPKIFDLNLPKLGVCYGLQTITQFYGGVVENTRQNEFGIVEIEIENKNKLLKGLPTENTVHMSHGDRVYEAPEGFSVDAHSPGCPIAAISHEEQQIYGVQFHPEMEASKNGDDILRNFLYDICGCKPNWTMGNLLPQLIDDIRYQVGNDRVILPIGGGLQSTVLAVLLHQAIGEQMVGLFIDHGLFRKNEPEQVTNVLTDRFGLDLIYLDERETFLDKLEEFEKNIEKERAFMNQLINILQKELSQRENIVWYATDEIIDREKPNEQRENGISKPEEALQLRVLEPLKKLHFHELKELGKELRIPEYILNQQLFPETVLATRVKGKVTDHKTKILRESEAIVQAEIFHEGLEKDIYQYYALLLQEDPDFTAEQGSPNYPILIRMIEWKNSQQTKWSRIPYAVMEKISRRITNEVTDVSQVYFDITVNPIPDQ